jgi:PAS domain S-box-containing protein
MEEHNFMESSIDARIQKTEQGAGDTGRGGNTALVPRENDSWYRYLFENNLDAILLTSPDGRIHQANQAACAMFGCTEEEFRRLGRGEVIQVLNPDLNKALDAPCTTDHFRGESVITRRDGTKFPADVALAHFTDKKGRLRTSLVIRDISERKRAEERMADAFRYNHAIIEFSPIGILVCTASGKVVSVNPAFVHMAGVAIDRILSENVFQLRSWKESGMLAAA